MCWGAKGQRITQLEDNPTTVPALTIVENGDVNQSGAFNNDYVISIEITQMMYEQMATITTTSRPFNDICETADH